ncbi:MAG: alpha-mannosidase [Synechocystis sp.]
MTQPNNLLPNVINVSLMKLRQLCQKDCQNTWHCLPTAPWEIKNWQTYPLGQVNEKNYLIWEKGEKIRWFAQSFTVPQALNHYSLQGLSLRLALTWWAKDAQIFVNDEFVQAGDLFDSKARILLTESVQTNQTFTVALRLVSPGHDIGGLMQSQLRYEREFPEREPGFIADELEVLSLYYAQFESDKLAFITEILAGITWHQVANQNQFDRNLETIRDQLLPLAKVLKSQTLNLLGHAHLDMAWLWTLEETWEVGERTFQSVINLQTEFPDLIFGHTCPALYEWIEQNRPQLFSQIQTAVKAGKWELLGGMWIEPDVNIISGEAIARQLLYGQRYFQSRFGQYSQVAWLPDSFGFCQQLPQLCQQGKLNYFVTGKLHWNDTNPFPFGAFNWRSPDGTTMLTVMSPPNLAGVMDTQPLPMANYVRFWQDQTGVKECLWLPGVGDHGGGPSRDMWQVKQRWQNSEFFPQINPSTAINCLTKIDQQLQQSINPIPIWDKELYLELHRGYFTVHADQKRYNRQCEHLLYEAELWSSFACWATGCDYPKMELETAWKAVLLNQFHDILPGTSIPEVFVTANQAWQSVLKTTQDLVTTALDRLSQHIKVPQNSPENARPLLIFNPLNWKNHQLVEIEIGIDQDYQVIAWETGQVMPSQISHEGKLLIEMIVPPLTVRGYWLIESKLPTAKKIHQTPELPILDTGLLRVTVDQNTGDLASIYDLTQQREVLANPGNQLQFFQDKGQYWDAWDIAPNYEEFPLSPAQLIHWQWLEIGPLRWVLRVIRCFQQSTFIQDYCLTANSRLLTIKNDVDWQEEQVMVKAAFPVNLTSETFTTEAPCAIAERPTNPQTDQEKAQWEVPHQHWFDLTDSNQNYGVSLLNDSKYSCDVKKNVMRLTLLRSSIWPDPNADRGNHQFTYQIYPHQGDWRSAETVKLGYALHRALRPYFPGRNPAQTAHTNALPSMPWLTLGGKNLGLMALKRHEDFADQWIVRCYETEGHSPTLNIETPFPYQVATQVNLLEEPVSQNLSASPWQITSFLLTCEQP